jgi:protein-L-isoaspartate(D-aspartate) O-methyltransferase
VRVVCADGAAGLAEHAPYDRVIATVGVWDLAPAWLEQLDPTGRIVVPLDVGGVHLSVAFERSGDHWTSRSTVPCGFMTMRGLLAGPERTRATGSGLSISVFDGRPIDAGAVSAALAGPPVEHTTDVVVTPAGVFDGLSLWLAAHEPRWCTLSEEATAAAARLGRAPLRVQDRNIAVGLLDGTSLAVLARRSEAEPGFPVSALGYGPRGATLAAALAGHVQAWQDAGRPGTASLRIDAYPRSGSEPDDAGDRMVIEKRHTRLVLSRHPG